MLVSKGIDLILAATIFTMRLLIYSVVLLLISITFSCGEYKKEWKTVTSDEWKASIDIPDYLEAGTEYSESAKIQGGNKYRNFYFIVDRVEEEVITDIHVLQSVKIHEFENGVKSLEVEDLADGEINGMPYKSQILLANVGGVGAIQENILYHHYFIQGKKGLYHMVIWHWEQWRENYVDVVPRMANSFKEL